MCDNWQKDVQSVAICKLPMDEVSTEYQNKGTRYFYNPLTEGVALSTLGGLEAVEGLEWRCWVILETNEWEYKLLVFDIVRRSVNDPSIAGYAFILRQQLNGYKVRH